ncbi:MAG: sulfur carrier protein ThiS [Actinomycetota bacterium]
MIQISVNGEPRSVEANGLMGLILAASPSGKGIAVALNLAVVPRSQWSEVSLAAGDELELLTAAAGG